MLSVSETEGPAPCPAPFNLAAHVLASGAQVPDKIALAVLGLSGAERWSYARLIDAVRGTGAGLLQEGLKPGDRILIRLGNTVDFPIAYLGAISVGLVPVPTSSQLTEPEVSAIIDRLVPAAILLNGGVACPATAIPVIDEATLRAMHTLPPVPWHMGDPERPAYIVFTSGTAGQSRAVVHAHRAILARQMMFEGWYGLREDDRLLHAGAFNWTYTLGTGLMDPWTIGATALIPAQGVASEQLPLLLKRHDATLFAAVPGVYRKILMQNMPPLPRLRHGLTAGEKLPESIRLKWQAATGKALHEAFGMSECSTFISSCPACPAAPGALGRAQPGRRIALLGEDGQPVPRGEEGTIAVHRSDPGLLLEYLDAPEATAARYQGDWFLTGDQAHMDEDGQIIYHGRSDDMMNAGGYRVSPIEVENVLLTYPGLTACAVTDVEVKPDVRVIMAFYTAPDPLPEADLAAHMARHLARYKCPRAFHHVAELPTGANSKIMRRALARPDLAREDIHGKA
jgi:acyl-coenzyme A synthetase/AMP-(fatty) acid ligase